MAKFTFNFTGATQTFAIPSGVSKATIKVWGGGGGGQVAGIRSVAGAGGYSYGEAVFTPGQILTIVVAKGGAYQSSSATALQGGGIGGLGGAPGSGGGGMSLVAFQGQGTFIIAGGGGGCGIGNVSQNIYFGGNGGGTTGNDVILTNLSPPTSVAAKGGTQGVGGAGGSYNGAGIATRGATGTFGQGGRGGNEGSGLNGGGGGGGGGLFGGGGGAGTNEAVGGGQEQPGGGGSGFIDTAVLSNAITQAAAANTTLSVAFPPNTSDPDYVAGIGIGPITAVAGGNGLVVIEFPSLSIVKKADKTFAKIGDVITYTINTLNNPTTISNVIFIDTIPSNTSFNPNSLTVDGVVLTGQNPNPPGVNIGTVGLGNTTITFSVTVTTLPSPNRISNISSLSATSLEVVNSNTVTTTIVSAILSSSKIVDRTFAGIGTILTYTIPIINSGNTTATSIIFLDTIPNGTTLVAGSFRQDGTLVSGTPNNATTLPNNIRAGGRTTVTFRVTVTTIPNPNPIPNTATTTGSYIVDSSTTPNVVATASTNTNTVNTTVNFASLGGITKSVDKSFASCGDTITYTIAAPNNGNVTALNVVFKDTIPNGTTLVPSSVFINGVLQSGANPSTGVTIPNIGPGTTSTLTFSVIVTCL